MSVHVPFVHKTTIGRGNRTLINGPLSRVESQSYGDLSSTCGCSMKWTRVKSGVAPASFPHPPAMPMLQFIFPDLWQNWICRRLARCGGFCAD